MANKILMIAVDPYNGEGYTYLEELCDGLAKKGVGISLFCDRDISVSDGLEQHHIDFSNNIKAFFTLLEKIKTEKPRIVHAFGGKAAKLCSYLRFFADFKLVVSVFTNEDALFSAELSAKTGCTVLTIDDEMRQLVLASADVREKNVFVSGFGSFTEHSAELIDIAKKHIKRELYLSDDAPIVLHYLSRDNETSFVTETLINNAERLIIEHNARIMIAGDSESFSQLLNTANAINGRLGKECILITGDRYDIYSAVSACDLYVGDGRNAVTAMSVGKPCIVMDENTYSGIFTHDMLNSFIKNSYKTDKKTETVTESLFEDISRILRSSDKSRARLGALLRGGISEAMPISRDTECCFEVYKALQPADRKILFSGYYGFNNSGDEAILSTTIKAVREAYPRTEMTVLSNDPKSTMDKYGCNAIERFSFFKVIKAIKDCDVLISGGGSLFQDTTSNRSLYYYCAIVYLAKYFKKKIMIYANGIGPVMHDFNRRLTAKTVETADVITIRDKNSWEELRDMGFHKRGVKITADPVFLVEKAEEDLIDAIFDSYGIPQDKPIITVSVRPWDNVNAFTDKVAKLCDNLSNKYDANILFLAMQPKSDGALSREIAGKMRNKAYIIADSYSPEQLAGIIAKSKILVGMRLHSLIFAAHTGVPFVGIAYDPKVKALLETYDMYDIGDTDNFDYLNALTVSSAVLDNYSRFKMRVDEKTKEMRVLSAINKKELFDLLDTLM